MENRSDTNNIRRKSSSSKKKRRKKDSKKSNLFLILLFYFFPIATLLIAYLIFRINYSPALTKDFVDELAFVKYLTAHNSHDFAEGWISTKPFIPLSTRYFLTYYFSDYATWQDALLNSVTAVYAIFSAAYIFFVSSLHAKKFYTYIIASVPAIPLAFIGLRAVTTLIIFLPYLFLCLYVSDLLFTVSDLRSPFLLKLQFLFSRLFR